MALYSLHRLSVEKMTKFSHFLLCSLLLAANVFATETHYDELKLALAKPYVALALGLANSIKEIRDSSYLNPSEKLREPGATIKANIIKAISTEYKDPDALTAATRTVLQTDSNVFPKNLQGTFPLLLKTLMASKNSTRFTESSFEIIDDFKDGDGLAEKMLRKIQPVFLVASKDGLPENIRLEDDENDRKFYYKRQTLPSLSEILVYVREEPGKVHFEDKLPSLDLQSDLVAAQQAFLQAFKDQEEIKAIWEETKRFVKLIKVFHPAIVNDQVLGNGIINDTMHRNLRIGGKNMLRRMILQGNTSKDQYECSEEAFQALMWDQIDRMRASNIKEGAGKVLVELLEPLLRLNSDKPAEPLEVSFLALPQLNLSQVDFVNYIEQLPFRADIKRHVIIIGSIHNAFSTLECQGVTLHRILQGFEGLTVYVSQEYFEAVKACLKNNDVDVDPVALFIDADALKRYYDKQKRACQGQDANDTETNSRESNIPPTKTQIQPTTSSRSKSAAKKTGLSPPIKKIEKQEIRESQDIKRHPAVNKEQKRTQCEDEKGQKSSRKIWWILGFVAVVLTAIAVAVGVYFRAAAKRDIEN